MCCWKKSLTIPINSFQAGHHLGKSFGENDIAEYLLEALELEQEELEESSTFAEEAENYLGFEDTFAEAVSYERAFPCPIDVL